MNKQKQNEELQSRREFFKEAAKKTLPVIGAIALASSPVLAKATEPERMGCGMGLDCTNACMNDCYNTCKGTCKGTCQGGCYLQCDAACRDNCSGTCRYSCYYQAS